LRSVGLILPVIAAAASLVVAPGHAQNASTSQFDHNPTGFPLTGTHVFVPCESCHINARYKTTPRACFGCHNGMTAPGAASVLSHPVTTNYCEGCHQTTTWRDYRFIDHVQALGPCANCHNNKIAAGKTPNHPITNAACNTCHFNTVTFKGGILPANPPQAPAATATKSGTTTPAAAATAPTRAATAPAATAASPTATMATPAAPAAPAAPPAAGLSNLPSTQPPSGAFNVATKPSHTGFLSGCARCHNGIAATGKRSNHVITNAACETCHKSTVTFAGARMNHTGLVANCASCHTGAIATGKPARHITTNAPCETCHKSTVTFAGVRMNHTGLIANCARCHTGAIATGKPARHIATNAPCETCHKSTMTFAGARVDHASLTGTCASCHNGTTAQGRPPRHVITTAPCDTCHRTRFWTPVTYRHTSPAYVNHGPAVSCSSCHVGNTQTVAWKFPAFKPNCAGCHVDKYRPMAHVKFERPIKVYYTVAELRDCTGSCHTYADSTQRAIVTRNFSVHRAFGGGW